MYNKRNRLYSGGIYYISFFPWVVLRVFRGNRECARYWYQREERERERGGGGVEGVSNNQIICSSLPMDRTGGGACKLFTSVVSGPLHESRVKPP